jgi:hypothetical protein
MLVKHWLVNISDEECIKIYNENDKDWKKAVQQYWNTFVDKSINPLKRRGSLTYASQEKKKKLHYESLSN